MVKKNDTNSKPVAPTAAAPSTPVTPAPSPVKRAVKPAAKTKKTVAKAPKAPAAVKAKRTPARPKAPTAPAVPAYTREDVALRAYFISEKRRHQGLHGDEHQDWIEAERQLLAESTKPAKKAKKA